MTNDIIETTLFDNKVLQIEFKNIKKNNALSLTMLDKLYSILSDANKLKRFSCIVFKGYKDGPFSSGADLKDLNLKENSNNLKNYNDKLSNILKLLSSIKVPKVCLVKSFCLGAGLIFAIHTDVIIADEKSIFALPASKLGIKLPDTQIKSISRKFPNKFFLLDIIISARRFTAKEAYNSNLVSQLLSSSNFKESYNLYIESILNNSKETIKYYLSKNL